MVLPAHDMQSPEEIIKPLCPVAHSSDKATVPFDIDACIFDIGQSYVTRGQATAIFGAFCDDLVCCCVDRLVAAPRAADNALGCHYVEWRQSLPGQSVDQQAIASASLDVSNDTAIDNIDAHRFGIANRVIQSG